MNISETANKNHEVLQYGELDIKLRMKFLQAEALNFH